MCDDYLVKPVLKAMQVLDCICSSDQALSLQHVSVEVDLKGQGEIPLMVTSR